MIVAKKQEDEPRPWRKRVVCESQCKRVSCYLLLRKAFLRVCIYLQRSEISIVR